MAGAFETAARAAIEELIESHAQASKFGFILTRESVQELTNDLFALLQTSRNLKSAGDRFLAGGGPQPAPAAEPRRAPRGPTLPVRRGR